MCGIVLRYKLIVAALLVLVAAISVFSTGYAATVSQLTVVPTRVVLEGRKSQDFKVVNGADDSMNYRVIVQHYSQRADGSLEETNRISKRQLLAQKMIRFSPRRSTLGPRQTQTLRVVARPLPNLPDGEYRVHLNFQPMKEVKKTQEPLNTEATGVSMRLQFFVGAAVPVFYRFGETHLKMTIDDFFEVVPPTKGIAKLSMFRAKVRLMREGNRSAFGDILILHKALGASDWATIGILEGVPVYLPNPSVTREVRLDLPSGLSPSSLKGQVKVQFRDRERTTDKIIAERVFNL